MKRTLALGLLSLGAMAHACGGVSREPVPVVFRGQTDIVIWDEEMGVEHFVRNARFDAKDDMAFLAPTPSIPKISAVGSAAFDQLTRLTVTPQMGSRGGGGFGGGGSGEKSSARPVVVVEMMDVGSYTAAILKAGDAEALRTWLKENDFPAPEWLEEWVNPYLKRGWTITAFKLKKGETRATGPIRMTFRTSTPFAPYAVPKENGGKGSKLRLFLVSESFLEGRVGGDAWMAKEIGRSRLSKEATRTLAANLGLREFDMPPEAVVRTFDDPVFGLEPTNDLFFIAGRPHEMTEGPGLGRGLLAMGVFLPILLFGFARRRRTV